MCGIVGYIGNGSAKEVIIDGLKTGYRGYDSAGIRVVHRREVQVRKCTGRINNLELAAADRNTTAI